MTDNPNNENRTFVTEQIKNKPVNKKRLLTKVGTAALCGLVFALCATLVFALAWHLLAPKQKSGSADLSIDTEGREEDTQTEETESSTEGTAGSASDPANDKNASGQTSSTEEAGEKVVIEQVGLGLEDYQALKTQLYSIGHDCESFVVSITGITSNTDWFNNTYENAAAGYGVIVSETDSEYLILAEEGAIPAEGRILVSLNDESTVEASVKAADAGTGITVLSLAKSDLTYSTRSGLTIAKIGSTRRIEGGQLVIALGSLLGKGFSIQTGCVTSSEYEASSTDTNYSLFTTDIPGSNQSSGVLVNTKGELIGLIMPQYNAGKDEDSLTAVSISDIEAVIRLLINGNPIPYAGLSLTTVTETIEKQYGIPSGVYIREVLMDSPAMEAGLQSGDVITAVGTIAVNSVDGFHAQLLTYKSGDQCVLTVERQGQEGYDTVKCTVTLGIQED